MLKKILFTSAAMVLLMVGVSAPAKNRMLSGKRLSHQLANLIGDAVYLSDDDQHWRGFFAKMDPALPLNEDNLRAALKIPNANEFETWSQKEVGDFWKYYIDDEPLGKAEAKAYAAVKAKMEGALTNIGIYRSTHPEVAIAKLFLIGRQADGTLVGLTTKN